MKKIIVLLSLVLTTLLFSGNVSATNVDVMNSNDLVTNSEATNIIDIANEIKKKYDVNVHFYIYDDEIYSNPSDLLVQQAAENKANDFMLGEYGGYDNDVIVIILGYNSKSYSSSNKWLEINCYGNTDKYISNNKASSLFSDFADKFSQTNDYAVSLEYLIEKINSAMLMTKIVPHLIILGVGVIIACSLTVSLAYSRGSKRTVSYNTYSNNHKLLGHYDRYVRTTVTRTPRQTSSGGSGGGSGGGGRSSGGGGRF